MHRNRGDAQFLAGAQDTQCDFAAIGYQDLIEHIVLVASSEWCQRTTIRYSPFAIRVLTQ
jgi:hypothetical protein